MKKPANGYIRYMREQRAVIKAANPTLQPREIIHVIGAKWRALSSEAKQSYLDAAAVDMQKYTAKRAEQDGPKRPKRPVNAYIIFMTERIEAIMEATPGINRQKAISIVAQQWRDMSPELKKSYKDQALLNQKRYADELAVAPPRKSQSRIPTSKIKKATPPYIFFSTEHYQKVVSAHRDWCLADISKELSKRWREMDSAARSQYVELYEQDKRRYDEEVAAEKRAAASAIPHESRFTQQAENCPASSQIQRTELDQSLFQPPPLPGITATNHFSNEPGTVAQPPLLPDITAINHISNESGTVALRTQQTCGHGEAVTQENFQVDVESSHSPTTLPPLPEIFTRN